MDLVLHVALSYEVSAMVVDQTKEDFIKIGTLQICFSLLPLKFIGVHINKLTNFSIIVLTWLG
jgi:hypothetical protein